ncbi:hypothetical protein B379_08080 [Anoxybacillus ayderensis G10]|nr:hypothetical protein B379_08080 [Anoxybacillus ayderensis G10]
MGRKSVPYPFQIHFRDTLSILHYTKFLTVPWRVYYFFFHFIFSLSGYSQFKRGDYSKFYSYNS